MGRRKRQIPERANLLLVFFCFDARQPRLSLPLSAPIRTKRRPISPTAASEHFWLFPLPSAADLGFSQKKVLPLCYPTFVLLLLLLIGRLGFSSVVDIYMPMLAANTIASSSLLPPVKSCAWSTDRFKCFRAGVSLPLPPLSLASSSPVGLGLKLQPPCGIRPLTSSCRKQSTSVICAGAMNSRCSASGQTQTVTREAPTITQAPVHSKEKSPDLDDGGTGFPPRDDDGGGGGGGGGGNWSGGFFLFGFLAFLGFLKDNESDDEYNNKRRR